MTIQIPSVGGPYTVDDGRLSPSPLVTMGRREQTGTMGVMTSGTIYGGAVTVDASAAGAPFGNIRFMTGTTAPSGTYTDMRACVLDIGGNVLAQTANAVGTVTAASTPYTLPLLSSVVPTLGQTLFLGLGFIATTMPTIRGFNGAVAIEADAPVSSLSKTGWTTGNAVPNLGAPVGSASIPYVLLLP